MMNMGFDFAAGNNEHAIIQGARFTMTTELKMALGTVGVIAMMFAAFLVSMF
ncbi:hypothetical protein [Shewanella sp. GXUN23E]|uniref:hypothetical protein n=1 Tax=Shewanella sp. GXUN23E TaxID=3422498 RepID=UPI003D7DBC9D